MAMLRLRDKLAIKDFVDLHGWALVRSVELARKLGCNELRTRKVDHLAVTYDELGNAICLCKDRIVRLYHPNEVGFHRG